MARAAKTMNYWYSIYGLLLIVVGWMSFRGGWSIEEAFGGLLILWGLKKLFMGHTC